MGVACEVHVTDGGIIYCCWGVILKNQGVDGSLRESCAELKLVRSSPSRSVLSFA
jgi:hypothetical protein